MIRIFLSVLLIPLILTVLLITFIPHILWELTSRLVDILEEELDK